MQVGDLVRIIAPEHIVGWPAGYVGIILEKLEPPDENDLGWLTFDIDINDHSAMVEKLDAAGIFKETLSEKQADNVGSYFVTLPSEVAMKLWQVI